MSTGTQETSGLLFSYVSQSQYHESCIPKNVIQAHASSDHGKSQKINDNSKSDAVSQDAVWRQALQKERLCLKNWEDSWGFLTNYDAKGNIKEKTELPATSNMFSDSVPNTISGNYGYRQATETGRSMLSLEKKFFAENRRQKMSSDMICY
uniref:Uncharacterized protein n=1 Tax=Arion vulgaris TaxID=1028688 RepID=A0A0B6YWI9_9EUPU